MPIYDYYCEGCDKDFEIVKSIKEYDGKDECPICKNIGQRIISTVTFYGEKVESAEYNVGLGKITKNSQHRNELAKQMNLIEVGSENPEMIQKKLENDRQEKLKKSWDDLEI